MRICPECGNDTFHGKEEVINKITYLPDGIPLSIEICNTNGINHQNVECVGCGWTGSVEDMVVNDD